MELVMHQRFLSPKEIEQRFLCFTNTKTYQIMKKKNGGIATPNFSNSIGIDLFFYDEETIQSTQADNMEGVTPIEKGYFIVTDLSDDRLLKAMYLHDSDNNTEVERAKIKKLIVTEGKPNIIKIDPFLNGAKKESYSKETSVSELKPNPDTFQGQSKGTRGIVFNKNKMQLSFPCSGKCCTFGGVDYQYCGSNCGERGDYGGGDARNLLDGCCFNHDYCYHKGQVFARAT